MCADLCSIKLHLGNLTSCHTVNYKSPFVIWLPDVTSILSAKITMSFKFHHPSTVIICGPTGSGKTWFLERVFQNQMIRPWPRNIIWFFSEWQEIYERLRTSYPLIKFVKGLEGDMMAHVKPNSSNLMVIDDQMDEASENKEVSKLFTKGSHHRDISVFLFVQNMFHKGKESRTLSLNTHYYVIFKNPRDKSQIRTLSCQMYPENTKFLVDSYEDATCHPYGYLMLDLRQETLDKLRVKTHVFPGENCVLYVPASRKGI